MSVGRPAFWDESPEAVEFFNAMAARENALWRAVQALYGELTVSKATDSLLYYADMYGVPQSADREAIRTEILARMRGAGVCNAEKLQRIARSHNCGEIGVREIPEEYTVEIVFESEFGTPKNFPALEKAVRDAVPAHLAIRYVYKYRTWAELEGYTWQELEEYTWQELNEGE